MNLRNSKYSPDITYYDAFISGTTQNGSSKLASFEETRTEPILQKCNDYYMSVVKFQVDASGIPLFVCPVIPNPLDATDPNYTPFVVSMSYNNVLYSQNVIFYPHDNGPIPQSPSNTTIPKRPQNTSTFYYNVYYYNAFIAMVNDTITKVFNKMQLANSILSGTQAPYYKYDATTELIRLYVPNYDISGINPYLSQFTSLGTPIFPQPVGTIYMFLDPKLYGYFDAIQSFYNISYLTTIPNFMMIFRDLKNYEYTPENVANTPITNQTLLNISTPDIIVGNTDIYTVQPPWLYYQQEYSIISSWNSLVSIVFITKSLPIVGESIPTISEITGQDNSGSSFRNIISDFTPDIGVTGSQRNVFTYVPSGPYRLICLNSDQPLVKVDFQTYWQDKNQVLHPLFVSYGKVNTLKLGFFKKSLYDSSQLQ
jgi:hypothetical protein